MSGGVREHPRVAGRPRESSPAPPRLIAWEVTRSCLLNCKHCRASAQRGDYAGELTLPECRALLENIASFARPTIILTGGEPMLRADIYDIAGYARDLGLTAVMAPCGPLLNDESVGKILGAGIRLISLSLDGATAASHDEFRGMPGAFEASVRGIESARRGGLEFQINTTVTRRNLAELPEVQLAVRLKARVFNPFLLVPTGRGSDLRAEELSAEQYEETLRWLAARSAEGRIPIRVTCAPHYQRILRQTRAAEAPPAGEAQAESATPPAGRGHSMPGGCLGGKAFAFISHRGKVQICGFLDVEAGDLRREKLDFAKIWNTSPLFASVRDVDSYRGRCGGCEFRKVCGGCRARAYAMTGDYLGEEPFCAYQPGGAKRKRKRREGQAEPCEGSDKPSQCLSDAPLDALDEKILATMQADFPLVERPFDELAGRLGTGTEELIERVERLRLRGFIRRLGAVFDARRLGYASTLVAALVPPERLDEVAASVSELAGVTHNYGRRHAYNLWFTLTARSEAEIERILGELRKRTGIREFYSLPATAVYKTQAIFRAGKERRARPMRPATAGKPAAVPQAREPELTEKQKRLARLLSGDVSAFVPPRGTTADRAAARELFAEIAARAGMSAGEALEQARAWKAQGVMRRFGVIVAHRKLGFRANGMAVFRVPEGLADAAGERLAEQEEVSHCYRRPRMPDWPYDLFAMVHGRTEEEVRAFVGRMAQELGLEEYAVLFSAAEYKKKSMRYFDEGWESAS